LAIGIVRSSQTGISLHSTGPLKKVLLCALALVVYFVREEGSRGRGFGDSSVRKVVLAQ